MRTSSGFYNQKGDAVRAEADAVANLQSVHGALTPDIEHRPGLGRAQPFQIEPDFRFGLGIPVEERDGAGTIGQFLDHDDLVLVLPHDLGDLAAFVLIDAQHVGVS